nr:response regulator [uncultured Methanoregula sp.]
MTGPTVMVVEDELIIAENLKVTLTGMGYEVPPVAGTSDEALSTADSCLPDLILMDIILEGSPIDGVETARRIRSRHDIPVVFVTAYADDETLERVKVTEPSAYILKPFNERELYSAIELALHRHRIEQEVKKRDNILFAISFAVEYFLRHQKESRSAKTGQADTFERGILEILEHMGLAVEAGSVAIFRMNSGEEAVSGAKIQYIWVDPATHLVQPCGKDTQITFTKSLWRSLLATGNYISGNIALFPEEERRFFEQAGISSVAIIPLFRNDMLWGFIGFSTTVLRQWSETEMEALRVAGNIVGALME